MVVRSFWANGTSLFPSGHFLVFCMFLFCVCGAMEHHFSSPQALVSLSHWCLPFKSPSTAAPYPVVL